MFIVKFLHESESPKEYSDCPGSTTLINGKIFRGRRQRWVKVVNFMKEQELFSYEDNSVVL